jgi:hypothetical protein
VTEKKKGGGERKVELQNCGIFKFWRSQNKSRSFLILPYCARGPPPSAGRRILQIKSCIFLIFSVRENHFCGVNADSAGPQLQTALPDARTAGGRRRRPSAAAGGLGEVAPGASVRHAADPPSLADRRSSELPRCAPKIHEKIHRKTLTKNPGGVAAGGSTGVVLHV